MLNPGGLESPRSPCLHLDGTDVSSPSYNIMRTAQDPSADDPDAIGDRDEGDAASGLPVLVTEPGLILLVEDDFVLRTALVELLRSEGYRVESCALQSRREQTVKGNTCDRRATSAATPGSAWFTTFCSTRPEHSIEPSVKGGSCHGVHPRLLSSGVHENGSSPLPRSRLGESLEELAPIALALEDGAHLVTTGAVAIETSMFQLDASCVFTIGNEANFDFCL
jgi:hypothetical protein